MSADKLGVRSTAEHSFSASLRNTVGQLEALGALCSVIATIWQRLLFERLLDVPPLPLVIAFWLVFAAFLGVHLLSTVPARRALAGLLLLAAVSHLSAVGLPNFGPRLELEEYRFRLAAHLSCTWHGLPLVALLAAAGVLAWAWLCAQSIPSRAAALASSTVVLLFGATAVLGYATGSPWPFGV